jgi:pyruvate formate lyase activating enzyme
MKESVLYEKLDEKNIRCKTCSHFCVVALGKRGICGMRENADGKLQVLNYSRAIAANVDPVEKKPLFHFLPGTKTFSFGTAGCNFRCGNCQNWNISQFGKKSDATREVIERSGDDLPPEKIIELAKENDCPSISYTYTEPTIFLEYALDTMKLAKKAGLKNIWVSNGFMGRETLKLVMPYLDAINIDIKSFDDKFYHENCGARIEPVFENCKTILKNNIWLETTTLLIPTLTDNEKTLHKIANFIKNDLGDSVPWHVSAFSGAISWKLKNLPETPIEKVKKAYEIGKTAGLKYVYAGNVAGSEMESTYCPKCGELIINRIGYNIKRFDREGKCKKCQESISIKE